MAAPDVFGWSNQLPTGLPLGDQGNCTRRSRRLVERDAVVAELVEHADAALGGAGRLVMIRGEAGSGKSSVIHAFADDFSGAVVTSHCDPVSPPAPLGPVIDLCDGLGQDVRVLLEHAIAQTDASGVPYAVASALAATAPVVWIIEDVHWADTGTLDVLRYVTRRLARMSVLLVVTYRDDEVGSRHPLIAALGDVGGSRNVARIDLSLLSVFGVRTLAGARPDIDVAELHRVTGGNPFLVTEALAAGRRGAIPEAVRNVMVGRLDQLSARGRAAAVAVAVLGADATVDLVDRVSPDPDVGVAECVSAGFLHLVGDRLAFRHELARRAVCASVPPDARRALHAAVLAALESTSSGRQMLSQLAFHAEKSEDTDAVLRYADAAAERAVLLGDYREAVHQYARALRHAGGAAPEIRAAWWERYSRAAISMITRGSADLSAFDAVWHEAQGDPASVEVVGAAGVMAAWIAAQRHDRTAATRYLRDHTDLRGDHNLAGCTLMRQGTRALLALDAGRSAEAETLAYSVLDRTGATPSQLLPAQVAAATSHARGGRGGVWPLLDLALEGHDPDDLMNAGIVWAARIEAAWLAGDKDAARAEAERALATLTDQVDDWMIGRIGAWAQIAGIENPSLPGPAAGPYARQLDGDWGGAATEWDQLGCPYQASIARLHAGVAGVAEAGLRALESLGADAAVAVGRSMVRARGGVQSGPNDLKLSSRQWQVAQLLVEQCTDREIADALDITPKTASHHVSAILSKLGVRTRAAARRRVLEARRCAS